MYKRQVVNLLNSPCLAAISTMAQQMQSRKWFWFAIIFQNVFAYCVALMFYQFGLLMEEMCIRDSYEGTE